MNTKLNEEQRTYINDLLHYEIDYAEGEGDLDTSDQIQLTLDKFELGTITQHLLDHLLDLVQLEYEYAIKEDDSEYETFTEELIDVLEELLHD